MFFLTLLSAEVSTDNNSYVLMVEGADVNWDENCLKIEGKKKSKIFIKLGMTRVKVEQKK